MIVYGHWVDRAYPQALDLGIRGSWVHSDTLIDPRITDDLLTACYGEPAFRFVLNIFLTEARITDASAWDAAVRPAITWLYQQEILAQCSLVQIHDEWWTALYSGDLARPPHGQHFPALAGLSAAECWAHRGFVASLLASRVRELRAIWRDVTGRECPPVGMSETGACTPPEFDGQDWWGLDVYQVPGGQYPTRASVQAMYEQAWAQTRLPIMPVIGLFEETWTLPSVVDLAQTYLPIIDSPRTFAVGVFCLHHPWSYAPDAGHPRARGILEMHPSYADGVRWLCAHVAAR